MAQTEIHKLSVAYIVKGKVKPITCVYYYSLRESQNVHVRWLMAEQDRQSIKGESRNYQPIEIALSRPPNSDKLLSQLKRARMLPLTTFAHGTKKDEIPDGYVSMT
jgi:hypothetical protein